MEKLAYVLIGPPGTRSEELGSTLRRTTAPLLRERGARDIQINLADLSLGNPFGVEPDETTPTVVAAVFMWVDSAEGSKAPVALPVVSEADGQWHGYLVTESEPLPNTTNPPGEGGRVPGFAQIVCLSKPSDVSWAEWRRRWQGSHTPVALNTQSTFRYVQNLVVRPLTPRAPAYAAVVEECFPAAAATDLHVFFDSGGDDAKLARHMAAMSDSCDRFMDGAAPVAWTTEYLIADYPG